MKVVLLLILLLPLASAHAQLDQTQFSAVVKQDEAVFSLPLPAQKSFVWRRKETRPNAQEYRMDVTVKNADGEFTFGYYLWKREGSNQQSGDLGDLLKAGQKSLFERTEPGRMTIVRDANVKVKVKDKNLVIELRGKDELTRIFSSKPAEAVFKIKVPDEIEIVQKIPIVYQ